MYQLRESWTAGITVIWPFSWNKQTKDGAVHNRQTRSLYSFQRMNRSVGLYKPIQLLGQISVRYAQAIHSHPNSIPSPLENTIGHNKIRLLSGDVCFSVGISKMELKSGPIRFVSLKEMNESRQHAQVGNYITEDILKLPSWTADLWFLNLQKCVKHFPHKSHACGFFPDIEL